MNTAPEAKRWKRRFFLLATAWVLITFLMSFPIIRGFIAFPLYVHEATATADVAYVMADGPASWERLRAASDLYHLKQVDRILVLRQTTTCGYNFVRHQSDTQVQRAIDFLTLHGVPADRIQSVPETDSPMFGSLSESRGVAKHFPDIKSIVVVTSAPHTRRSLLCFRRSLSDNIDVHIYAATTPSKSDESTFPIWIEYAKLIVYFFVA